LAIFFTVSLSAAAEEISDAAIRKMKVKTLKQFLDARGISCNSCVEKGDWVKRAIEVKNVPIKNEAMKPIEVKSDPLWEQWRDNAKEICEKDAPEDKKADGYCKSLAAVVENLVMRYSKKYHKELSIPPIQLTKHTMTHPYRAAGEMRIKKGLKWMLSTNTKSQGKLESQLEKPLASWLRDCALQNINTMLETLDEL